MAITSLIAPSHKLYFLARHCRSRLTLFIPVYVGELRREHTFDAKREEKKRQFSVAFPRTILLCTLMYSIFSYLCWCALS